ncbi:hypothetical protein ElyMa_003066300 [Elysia marginata]|uniref:Uncharacterized protein n=1 Tax=Elysia marginata TaxID=1093978 RepID=A0AAV4IK30_9GAST|nr:hypothetical protein ElyMa_003066300 [Elysia marginata]
MTEPSHFNNKDLNPFGISRVLSDEFGSRSGKKLSLRTLSEAKDRSLPKPQQHYFLQEHQPEQVSGRGDNAYNCDSDSRPASPSSFIDEDRYRHSNFSDDDDAELDQATSKLADNKMNAHIGSHNVRHSKRQTYPNRLKPYDDTDRAQASHAYHPYFHQSRMAQAELHGKDDHSDHTILSVKTGADIAICGQSGLEPSHPNESRPRSSSITGKNQHHGNLPPEAGPAKQHFFEPVDKNIQYTSCTGDFGQSPTVRGSRDGKGESQHPQSGSMDNVPQAPGQNIDHSDVVCSSPQHCSEDVLKNAITKVRDSSS